MTRHLPTGLTVAAIVVLATACGSTNTPGSTPGAASTDACYAAMLAQMKAVEANPNGPTATRPPACAGVSDATLQQFGEKILAQYWQDMSSATAFPSAFPTSG